MLVLCDLDGTLVFPAEAVALWAAQIAIDYEQSADFGEWLAAELRSGAWERRTLFADIQTRLAIDRPHDELHAEFTDGYLSSFRCADENLAALGRLRDAGHNVAVITNGPPSQLQKLRSAGIADLFDAVCISEVEGFSKPDVRVLHRAAQLAGCELAGGWVIGDSPDSDVGAAHAYGLSSVWLGVESEWPRADFQPTVIAADFAAAVDVVIACAEPERKG